MFRRIILGLMLTSSLLYVRGLDNDQCHLDEKESCYKLQRCRRYDPEEFKTSPSIFTYIPFGRLGNTISAYMTLLWVKLDFGLDVYMERDTFKMLDQYFENIGGGIKILEDHFCDWREFGFKHYEENVEKLADPEWHTGLALNIHPDTEEAKKNQPQKARKFQNMYRPESREALRFKSHLREHAETTFENIAKQVGKPATEITFVGIHNRRTDYIEFRNRYLDKKKVTKNFFLDAMEYFREEFSDVVFVYVSDDMEWGRKKFRKVKDIYFVGCGDSESQDCVGLDIAVLGSCNHSIITQGSFGFWAGVLTGGEIYTEYGTVVPSAFVLDRKN